jgi:16S rRNA (uracil1498-N3)-methyltransferase
MGGAIAAIGSIAIIRPMRRLRVERVKVGQIELAEREAHHARDVLRLEVGAEVEVFDAEGKSAIGKIDRSQGKKVVVRVEQVEEGPAGFEWWVASAVPKGTRGDWMVEKLSELGAGGFVPLITERSVVSAEGKNKRDRWERLASEAAKQSKRKGVMKIAQVTEVEKFAQELKSPGWYLSLDNRARAIGEVVREILHDKNLAKLTLLIGPEGGWTDGEIRMFNEARLTGVRMGGTILRVETAAVAASAIVAAMVAPVFLDEKLESA